MVNEGKYFVTISNNVTGTTNFSCKFCLNFQRVGIKAYGLYYLLGNILGDANVNSLCKISQIKPLACTR